MIVNIQITVDRDEVDPYAVARALGIDPEGDIFLVEIEGGEHIEVTFEHAWSGPS